MGSNHFSLRSAFLKKALSHYITKQVIDKLGQDDIDIDILNMELDGDESDDLILHVEADVGITAESLAAILEKGSW